MRIPRVARLIPQEELESSAGPGGHGFGINPMEGSPYALETTTFESFLGIPCNAPSWGTMTGIDLKTCQIAWQRPLGTVEDVYMFGVKVRAPIPIGMPSLATAVTTGSGLAF